MVSPWRICRHLVAPATSGSGEEWGFLSGEVSIRPEIQSELASVWHLPSQDSCVDQADSRTDRKAADMGMLAGQTKDRGNGNGV